MRFYTFGYQRKDPIKLAYWLQANNALLLDIRFSPRTPARGWHGTTLHRRVGVRYLHCKDLGNKNYQTRGAPIEIQDPSAGIATVEELGPKWDAIVLMCACFSVETCHRKVVADLLRAKGHTVAELDLGALGNA